MQEFSDIDAFQDSSWAISDSLFQSLIADARDLRFLKAYGVEGWEFYAEAMVASEGHIRED